jgi:probable F420-dependent oxidoreductase
MHVGLSPYGLAVADYPALAQAAEERGFESIWLPDHLVIPQRVDSRYPYSPDGESGLVPDTEILDPWVILSFIGAATTRLRLGTYVYILPLRHPFVTAKAAASVDVLSGGRLLMGIGAGWLSEEFEAAGEPFAERGRRSSEAIEIMRALWTREVVTWDGDHYPFGAAGMSPRPDASIPVLVGGHSGPALRRAAALGDGWIGSPKTAADLPAHLDEMVPRIEAALEGAGRSREGFELTSGVMGPPSDEAWAAASAALDRVILAPWILEQHPVALDRATADLDALAPRVAGLARA